MKAYKLEILIVDHDNHGGEIIAEEIRSNHFYNVDIKRICGADIGEWSDDHPLNKRDSCALEYKRLFEWAK